MNCGLCMRAIIKSLIRIGITTASQKKLKPSTNCLNSTGTTYAISAATCWKNVPGRLPAHASSSQLKELRFVRMGRLAVVQSPSRQFAFMKGNRQLGCTSLHYLQSQLTPFPMWTVSNSQLIQKNKKIRMLRGFNLKLYSRTCLIVAGAVIEKLFQRDRKNKAMTSLINRLRGTRWFRFQQNTIINGKVVLTVMNQQAQWFSKGISDLWIQCLCRL